MIHSINIPDPIIHIFDLNHIRIQIKRHFLLKFQHGSVLFLEHHLSLRIYGAHIPLVGSCRRSIIAPVEYDQIGIFCHFHKKRFHIFQIYIKSGRVHHCNNLSHKPPFWHIHIAEKIHSPHTVIFQNDLCWFIFLLAFSEKPLVKFAFILQHNQCCARLLQDFLIILFHSFLAGQNQIPFSFRKIRIGQRLQSKSGLSTLQKSVNYKYRNFHCQILLALPFYIQSGHPQFRKNTRTAPSPKHTAQVSD